MMSLMTSPLYPGPSLTMMSYSLRVIAGLSYSHRARPHEPPPGLQTSTAYTDACLVPETPVSVLTIVRLPLSFFSMGSGGSCGRRCVLTLVGLPLSFFSMGSGGSCGSQCVLTLVRLPLSCLFVFSGCLYSYQDIKVRGVHVQVPPLTPLSFSSYTSSFVAFLM